MTNLFLGAHHPYRIFWASLTGEAKLRAGDERSWVEG